MNKLDKKNTLSNLIKLVVKNTPTRDDNLVSWGSKVGLLRPPTKPSKPPINPSNRWMNHRNVKLRSYLSVCVDSGHLDRAVNLVINHERGHVSHFNIVLKGCAQKGSLGQLHRLKDIMYQKNIAADAQTYAMFLLGYAKSNKVNNRIVGDLLDQMSQKWDIRKIFHTTYFNEEERTLVNSLIKKVKPDFEEIFMKVPIKYNCNLMDKLDNKPLVNYDIGPPHDSEELIKSAEEQLNIEKKTSLFIKSVANSKIPPAILNKYNQIWQKHVEIWRAVLTKTLQKELREMQECTDGDNKVQLYPYLCSINRDTLVELMLDEIEKNSNLLNYSASAKVLHRDLGLRVWTYYILNKEMNDGSYSERKKIYSDYLAGYYVEPKTAGKFNSRQFIQTRALQTKNYAIYRDYLDRIPEWPHSILISIGKFLYGILLNKIKFDQLAANNPKRHVQTNNMVDAFYTAYCQLSNTYKIKEEFRTHRDLQRLQRKCAGLRLRFTHCQLPCCSPPMPWLSTTLGGYLSTRSSLSRIHYQFDQNYLRNGDQQKLYPSLDSLNALALCPWIINHDILDLVIKLFRSGGDPTLKVPYDENKMKLSAPVNPGKDASEADKIMFRREHKNFEKKKAEMYSLWSDCLYRLSIANYFRDKVFWFPHNLDFRGRTYPIPPHFNHLGSDLPRSLLLFAKGMPLGDKGLDWLKIHLINLTGSMKKSPVKDRLDYANSILHSDILDSADNPLDGKRWWTKYENPWQVLACCKEISKAIRSKNVKEYVSHYPVHQDGSCNGLQHYAALGRDIQGALSVNLIPSEKPHDVYSHIVDLVEQCRVRDEESGDQVAKMLNGLVQRKVIKQTVMTTVYGVTRYGARQQIARQLSAKGYPEEEIWKAARYLSEKTFDSIGKIFTSSTEIQSWLNRCAQTVASRFNQFVEWETPLGLHIIQPYMKKNGSVGGPTPIVSLEAFEIMEDSFKNGHFGLESSNLSFEQQNLKRLNPLKHKTAFPPNYIHSLDSSHMMLTSLYSQRAGITFVSVHDCFWTHPSTVDVMNVICREQFIDLHSQPLLENLGNYFIKRYVASKQQLIENHPETTNNSEVDTSNNLTKKLLKAKESANEDQRLIFSNPPKKGDLDLNVIRDSTYFFS